MIHPYTYTAEVLSVREWGSYFISFIYLFHFTFMLGHNAGLTLGFLAILMLVNVFVGAYYSWPRTKKTRNWLVARNQKITPIIGRLRRSHLLAGLILLPVFIVVIISGISLIFPNQTQWLLNRPAKATPVVKKQPTGCFLFNGEAFDLTGPLFTFISGLLTTLLSIADGWLWYRRKFRRKKKSHLI